MSNQDIVIKPYEPIDDEYLTEMCINNLFQTQRLTRAVLIEWTIKGHGYLKVVIALSLTQTLTVLIFQFLGFEFKLASILSFALVASVLGVAYGIVLPKHFKHQGAEYAKTVRTDFADIQGKFMGEKKCFWLATQKVEAPELKEKIVGCVLVEPYKWEKDEFKLADRRKELGEIAELRRMSVDSKVRGKGIGLKLGLELMKFCKEKGYNTVMLTALAKNYPAIALYKKIGFEVKASDYHHEGTIVWKTVRMEMKL